ncbi:hypothetical protein ACWDOP_11380 [Nocardia sp. NPDC003693]
MPKFIKVAMVALAAAVLGLGFAQPASADISIRDSQASDLYLRDNTPSLHQIEKAFAAFWNPNINIEPKIEVSYNGSSARPALERVMQASTTYDFFSIQGRAIGPVQVSGNNLSVKVEGLMAGFPASSTNYHFLRDGGIWKFDWKATCAEMQCSGNPDFGY